MAGVCKNLLKQLDEVKSEMITPAMIWSCELPDRPATIIPPFYLKRVGHIEVPVSIKKVLPHYPLFKMLNNNFLFIP